jgi:hypothetical protein
MAAVGVSPIIRKQVAGKYLDEIADGEMVFSQAAIDSMDFPSDASDNWRKKYCLDGAGLMSFTVMGDAGVNVLHACLNGSGFKAQPPPPEEIPPSLFCFACKRLY